MAYARFQQPAQDAAGNLLTNIWCEVRREDVAGNPLEPLFADRMGDTPLSNPFFSPDGVPAFHAAGGAYRIRVYRAGYDETYRYVGIGLAAESDLHGLTPMGAWDDETTYTIGDVVTHPDGPNLYLFASKVTDNLNEEPDVTPADTAFWMYAGVAVEGPAGPIGPGLDFDEQADDIAARAAFDGEPEGFRVLVSDTGDGRAAVYVMGDGGSGDWSAPAYLTGSGGAVESVAGKTGAVTLQVADITDMSANGRSLVSAANYAAMKALLAYAKADVSGLGTGDSPEFTAVNIGHASDTTVSRGAAGFIAVEGKRVPSPASQAAGDVLYRGGTEWERLAKGTAGQVLTMNSVATAPEWADVPDSGGTWSPIGTVATTSGTTQTLALGGTYKELLLVLREPGHSSGSDQSIRVAISDDGTNFGSARQMNAAQGSSSGPTGHVRILNTGVAGASKIVLPSTDRLNGGAYFVPSVENTENGITHSLRFSPSGGNFDSGAIDVYGLS